MPLQQFRNWGTLKQIVLNAVPQRAPHIREGLGHTRSQLSWKRDNWSSAPKGYSLEESSVILISTHLFFSGTDDSLDNLTIMLQGKKYFCSIN